MSCGSERPQPKAAIGSNEGAVSTYNQLQCRTFAFSKKRNGKGGCCAGWVKAAMVASDKNDDVKGGGGNLNNQYEANLNACAVTHWMEYWGFKKVLSGDTKTLPDGFQPLDGDILISAGFAEHKYGHIQIYDSTNKNWIADIIYQSAGVYADGKNLWVIYRK